MMRKLLYGFLFFTLFLVSCKKDFFNINNDPNNPVEVPVSILLPTAERSLGDALSLGSAQNGGLSEDLEVYVHRLTTRQQPDQYGVDGNDFYLGLAWPKLYAEVLPSTVTTSEGVLQNLEVILQKATVVGNARYAGIAKILKAYTYSQLVDVFGDVPFSEANKLDSGIVYPKFDAATNIYPRLFALLDEGIADLSNTSAPNISVPGSDDVIYGGDEERWKRAANTIKLKLYTQLRKVQDVSAAVNSLINTGDLISRTEESFLLPYGPKGATDDRNPGFGDYYATQRQNYISPWFYEILKGQNPNINTGITDPRIPYYFYNQLTSEEPAENPVDYRDSAFLSVYFGSVGPNQAQNQQNSMTVVGIYPAGGRYDDGEGEVVSSSSGTGATPYRFITYADRLYLEAELMQAGVVSGNAKAKLQAAIEESFRQVDYVIATYVKPAQTVPTLSGSTKASSYISTIAAQYNANPNKQLEIIMTQKWIASFGSAVDAYTDYRRTGYPVLFDPNNPVMAPGGKVQPPINGDPQNPGAQPAVPVQLSRTYPLSLPWYQPELESNPNAPKQKNPSSYKLFWMP